MADSFVVHDTSALVVVAEIAIAEITGVVVSMIGKEFVVKTWFEDVAIFPAKSLTLIWKW